MKKLSKKAWKEYFDDEWNWLVVKEMPDYGMRITRLDNTEVYALEKWNFPAPYLMDVGFKPSWVRIDCFVIHEDGYGNVCPEQMNKTNVIDMLWSNQGAGNA